jgi:hypothetical protein
MALRLTGHGFCPRQGVQGPWPSVGTNGKPAGVLRLPLAFDDLTEHVHYVAAVRGVGADDLRLVHGRPLRHIAHIADARSGRP